ncbi:MAG: PQQ-binding-like beta-propeller repeat protein [Spirochaetaceae bacterium]|jgi:outer membrane protein assembly factor BamB|nr:PQQ-binding-like beta-propeller repeat protein [Spirochaetaceae bacterium]
MRRRGFLAFFLITALSPLPGQDGEGPPPVTAPIWREALEGMVTGLPSVQGGTVVAVLDGGNLKAYSRRGTLLWDYFAGGKLAPYITRSREGLNYICRTNGTFIVLNRVGRELWRMNLDAPLSSPVLVGWDGRLFIPLGDRLICYTASGYPLWGKTFPAPIALAPITDTRGGLMMVLENGEFLSIDPFGKTRSRMLPAIPVAITPLTGGGDGKAGETFRNQDTLIFYEAGTVDVLSRDAGGNQTLLSGTFPSLPAPPLAAVSRGGLAALTLIDGRVLFLSGSGGRILWTGESHLRAGGTSAAPKQEVSMIFDEWGIYVLSRSGASGFTEDGRRLWMLELTGTAAIPVLSDEGALFAGGEDWILYAYQMEDRTGSLGRSSSGPPPEGSYGLGAPPPLSWTDYSFGLGEIDTQLSRIRRDIFAGRVGENERDHTAYLMELSGSFIRTPGASAVRPPVHIQHRIAGAQLLGYIGSRETIPFLVTLLYYEQEPLVKIAAVEAIGRIGLDPEGAALRVFSTMLAPTLPGGDERVLTAIAGATGALCRFSGPPLSNAGVKILSALTAGDYPPLVRDRAQAELNALRR